MEYWQELLRKSVESKEEIIQQFGIKPEVSGTLQDLFQTRVNPSCLSLIRHKGDPIWLQCVPDEVELQDIDAPDDPLGEDAMSPVPSITHRYPDRVLFLVTSQCSMYCRF